METWLENIRRDDEVKSARAADIEARREEKSAQGERRRLGVDERVKRIVANLPDSLKGQPLQISFFRERMGAKWRPGGRAHAGEIGGALTRLGWSRRRVWKSDQFHGRYPAVWYPPEDQ